MARLLGTPERWDMEVDLVAVGASGGGLVSAITGHDKGLSTAVLEKAIDTVGGGSIYSGGGIWIPSNHHMTEKGISDSREEALTYVRCTSKGRHDEEKLAAYLDNGPEMIRYLGDHTPLKLAVAAGHGDYHEDVPGGKKSGRLLLPDTLPMAQLLMEAETTHPFVSTVRRSPFPVFTPVPLPTPDLRFYVGGRAFIGALVLACLNRGIRILTGTRARRLVVQDGQVVGVRAERDGRDFFVRGRRGVLLATGGYEWNSDMNKKYMRVSDIHGITPPANEGDGHIMGMEIGAATALMDFGLLMPTIRIPGEELDGKPMYRIFMFSIGHPGSILVNRFGRRCCDEPFYPDIGRAFEAYDELSSQSANLPLFWIADQSFRERVPVGPLRRGTGMADWLHRADTLPELAEQLGLPADNLRETVERFNMFAQNGHDPDFHRGESAYDLRWGLDPNRKPNPVLGPLSEPPFYGLQIHVGSVGNLGGLVTNGNAQVIDVLGEAIPGLYATSNTAASLATGLSYTSGMSMGASTVFGYVAAQHMTQQERQ